jgi:hypothetical protein
VSIDFKISKIDFVSEASTPINLSAIELNVRRVNSGLLSIKLGTSWLPTLAPEGAQALPRNLLSVITSISIDFEPLLLKTILPFIDEIKGIFHQT